MKILKLILLFVFLTSARAMCQDSVQVLLEAVDKLSSQNSTEGRDAKKLAKDVLAFSSLCVDMNHDLKTCSICYNDEVDCYQLSCGCTVEKICMSTGIDSAILSERQNILTTCPVCSTEIEPQQIAFFCEDAALNRISQLVARQCPGLKVCPMCSQGIAVRPERTEDLAVCCSCHEPFCYACEKRDHAHGYCQTGVTDEDLLDAYRAAALAGGAYKICFLCRTLFAKKDGCDEVVCGKNANDKNFIGASIGRGCGRKFNWAELESLKDYLIENDTLWVAENIDQVFSRGFRGRVVSMDAFKLLVTNGAKALTGVKLRNGVISFNLVDLNLSKANLIDIEVNDQARINQTSFDNATISNVDFGIEATLRDCDFNDTMMEKVVLRSRSQANNIAKTRGSLAGCILKKFAIDDKGIGDIDLADLVFDRMDLSKLSFKNRQVENIEFRQTKLERHHVEELIGRVNSLAGAILMEQDLGGLDFSNMSLRNVDFTNASIKDAVFDGADIEGAKFVNVKGINFEQIKAANHWRKAKYDDSFITTFRKRDKLLFFRSKKEMFFK